MASYDIEHSVDPSSSDTTHRAPRVDWSSFHSHTNAYCDTSSTQNSNATVMPSDIAAAFNLAVAGYQSMGPVEDGEGVRGEMIEDLLGSERVQKGVGQEFLDELDRVPRKALKKGMDCPICGNAFLDDEYPLVVRLPCSPKHIFDLECIAPWLTLKSTCPLDRKNLVKPKKPPPQPRRARGASQQKDVEEEEEEEDYGMYA